MQILVGKFTKIADMDLMEKAPLPAPEIFMYVFNIQRFMRDKGKSYVCILTNKSFRDNLLKIGVSDKPMDELIEWLDNEDLPDPYDPFAIVQTEEANMLENAFHRLLDHFKDCHCNSECGFYILPPEQALGSLFTLVIELGIKDAVVLRYDEGAPRQVFPPVNAFQAQLEDMQDKD